MSSLLVCLFGSTLGAHSVFTLSGREREKKNKAKKKGISGRQPEVSTEHLQ